VDLTTLALAAGGAAGLGLALLGAGLFPATAPDLRAALARLDAAPASTDPSEAARTVPAGWREAWLRAGAAVAARLPAGASLTAPAVDLRLLDVPAAGLAAAQASAAALGLLLPGVLWAVAGLAGLAVPVSVPAVVGLGLAAAGWLLPAAVVRRRARTARTGLRVALSAYLDLVALERAGAGSPVEALESAAAVGHGPGFALIASRLTRAARTGSSPYAALAELAGEVGVVELRDLADIAATAADGAAIYTSLLAKARSLRNQIATDAHAAANEASERMVFPVVLIGTAFLLLVFYPALARLLGSG
jgi:Type II secretion system (T2SS), protein F